MNGRKSKSEKISAFYGLNRTKKNAKGEMSEMLNMGTVNYPCLSPRPARKLVTQTAEKAVATTAPHSSVTAEIGGFTGICDGSFWYDGIKKSGKFALPSDYYWEIICMGNLYVMNGYDSENNSSVMYFYNVNTEKFDLCGDYMDDLIVTAGKNNKGNYLATFRYGFDAVVNYSVVTSGGQTIKNQDFFKKYSSGVSLPKNNIFEQYFDVGDDVTISGFPTSDENVGQVWQYNATSEKVIPQSLLDFSANNTIDSDLYSVTEEMPEYSIVNAVITAFETTTVSVGGTQRYVHYIYFTLADRDGEEINFDAMESGITNYCSGVVIAKRRRTFDHICSHHNRIWGTVPTGGTVYASSSDDIFSFTSADVTKKFAVRLTSSLPGKFTGMCSYQNELILFKEDSINTVYGTNPSEYRIWDNRGIGCISPKSIAITPNGIIFHGYGGFYIFAGNTPVCISEKLNSEYIAVVGSFFDNFYYACAGTQNGHELILYDMRYGTWHRQDDIEITDFFTFRGKFYFAADNKIYCIKGGDEKVSWSFTMPPDDGDTFDNKSVCEIWFYAQVEEGANFHVETCEDNRNFRSHATFTASGRHIFRCPIRTLQSRDFQIRVSGVGDVIFFAIEIVYTYGGRIYAEAE